MSYPTKDEMWQTGKLHAINFCEANALPVPAFIAEETWPFGSCAYYRMTKDGRGKVVGCVKKMAHIGTAGQAWSYPGHIIDRTPYGVIAHEMGHHVDAIKGNVKQGYISGFSVLICSQSQETKLTNYCPNTGEWFAEMMRLFITNPNLLKAIRPKTFSLLTLNFIKPIETRSFQEVLKDAPERTLQLACKRVLKGV